ncbi:hypothetical protein G5V58_16940 [Nocardioides anomalus]|uniref:RiboL-PSP-HEPN domain-containing protein n=1 Tax=Nocardioides anomalus TaxID=2712223 RepID=A0A6G6WGL8_9ACTN|nr:hypothetical protein [Nocardioides anomalus]QIG44235.1 hypothetical protein G5V58_16940 [Nocardioides anomalus]
MDPLRIADYRTRSRAFTVEAHAIFSIHEDARKSRVVEVHASFEALDELSLKQDDLFRQALRCAENGLYRAAHVMAWAAFMDYLEEMLASDGLVQVRALRPAWKGRNIEEMREYVTEHAFVETTQPLGLCTKNQMKALLGLLNKRNECAHPSDFYPGVNETLGYISEVIQRTKQLQAKSL